MQLLCLIYFLPYQKEKTMDTCRKQLANLKTGPFAKALLSLANNVIRERFGKIDRKLELNENNVFHKQMETGKINKVFIRLCDDAKGAPTTHRTN